MFVDAENGDYRLQPGSPCIDAGNPAAVYNDVDGSRNDMGAYGGPRGNDWTLALVTDEAVSVNRVLSLDGDGDYMQNLSPFGFPLGNSIRTIEAWIYPQPEVNGNAGIIQYGKNDGSGGVCGLIFSHSAPGKLYFWGHLQDIAGDTSFPKNKWYHIAMTYDGVTGRLYVNSSLDASKGLRLNTFMDSSGLTVGYGNVHGYLHALIDEVRIWNVVRTQEEIQATMNTELSGNQLGLVGYWNFDDGRAKDLSRFGNHGELKGNAMIIETDLPTLGEPPFEPSIYQGDLRLTQGLNIFALPLVPETSITASQLAADLGATIVIRIVEDRFQAYVSEQNFGLDFPIEIGKGYIVNVVEPTTYTVTGWPWGTPVSAAPAPPITETWAFVIAGRVDGMEYDDTAGAVREQPLQIRVTNGHTGETRVAPISPSGEFIVPFVDMSRRSVVAVGDEIATQLIGPGGVSLTDPKRHLILPEHLAHASLLTRLSGTPDQARLLQNYPNPFNPETWIPFQLSRASAVEIDIYNLKGYLIRRLNLGHHAAGWYLSRERAAYWDGRNRAGEKISSGIYFYRLHAGDFSAQRKLVVAK